MARAASKQIEANQSELTEPLSAATAVDLTAPKQTASKVNRQRRLAEAAVRPGNQFANSLDRCNYRFILDRFDK